MLSIKSYSLCVIQKKLQWNLFRNETNKKHSWLIVFKIKKNRFHKKHLNFIEECRKILANSRKLKSHFWPDLTDLTWVACFQFHPEKQTWDFCFLTECNYFDWTNFLLIEECGFTFMKEIECISDLNFSSCCIGRAQHKQFYTNLNNYLIILIN